MIPVSDNVRKLLLQAVQSELEQLQIESKIPQGDRGMMSDAEYSTMIEQYKVIQQDLLDNRLVIFDTRPRCTHVDNSKSGNIEGMAVRCEAEGRYSPIIFIFMPKSNEPLAQLDVQPPQWCCVEHAHGKVDEYMDKPGWREIQARVKKQTRQLIHFGDVRIMYMDNQTQNIVLPPTPAIVLVDAPKGGVIN